MRKVCDTTRKDGHDKRTGGTKIGGEMGQDGERRNTYSAAVIEGLKRNSTIYVGDSIVRSTYTTLSKGEDVVVCLPGTRIEHRVYSQRESRTDNGKMKWRVHTSTRRDEHRRQVFETGSKDTGIRSGWHSTVWWSSLARKGKWDSWICRAAKL